METQVVVPFLGTCPYRKRALAFTVPRYPWPVKVSTIDGKWSKARAVNPAVRDSTADIIVVADADCVTPGLPAAVEAVAAGAPWAIPHEKVYRLTHPGTTRFMETGEIARPFVRCHQGIAGGGFVVAHREVLVDVPLDPRFTGWGQEDSSWAIALNVLHGRPWRGSADLIHLWHPPAPRQSKLKGSPENWELHLRYRKARRHPEAMRSILEEVR